MFKTKLVALLVLVSVLFAFSVNLNAKDLPGDKAGRKADYMYKKLTLSLDQYTKTYQAFLAYEFKVQDNMKQYANDKKACKDACDKAKTALTGELSKILTKEQNVKFEPMKDKVIAGKFMKKKRVVKKVDTTKEEGKKDENKDVKKDTKTDKKVEKKEEKKN